MKIGRFTFNGEGYIGRIEAFGLFVADVQFTPAAARVDNGPDFIITQPSSHGAERVKIGSAWKKTGKAGKTYLSFEIDSPMLSEPICGDLTARSDGTFSLVWRRLEAEVPYGLYMDEANRFHSFA